MMGRAVLRNALMSPRKIRGMANLIKGKNVGSATAMLSCLPKKSARILYKLVLSAVANAENKGRVDVDSLVIENCFVDNGPILKRMMTRSMGRANRIQHRTSHITVLVSEKGN